MAGFMPDSETPAAGVVGELGEHVLEEVASVDRLAHTDRPSRARHVGAVRIEGRGRTTPQQTAASVEHQGHGGRVAQGAVLDRPLGVPGAVPFEQLVDQVPTDPPATGDLALELRMTDADHRVRGHRHLDQWDVGAEHHVGGRDVVAEVELRPVARHDIVVGRSTDPDDRDITPGDLRCEQQRRSHVGQWPQECHLQRTVVPEGLLDDESSTRGVDGRDLVEHRDGRAVLHAHATPHVQQVQQEVHLGAALEHAPFGPPGPEMGRDDAADIKRG
jgi:hypothetical protein